jgi:hypothetical protein
MSAYVMMSGLLATLSMSHKRVPDYDRDLSILIFMASHQESTARPLVYDFEVSDSKATGIVQGIAHSRKIIFVCGAGISTACGLQVSIGPTYCFSATASSKVSQQNFEGLSLPQRPAQSVRECSRSLDQSIYPFQGVRADQGRSTGRSEHLDDLSADHCTERYSKQIPRVSAGCYARKSSIVMPDAEL